MSIKIKILKEDKKRIDESLTDLLADGAMLAAIATALGVSVVMLKAALSGQKGDASMIAVQNVRDRIAQLEAEVEANSRNSRRGDPPMDGADMKVPVLSPAKERELKIKAARKRMMQADS